MKTINDKLLTSPLGGCARMLRQTVAVSSGCVSLKRRMAMLLCCLLGCGIISASTPFEDKVVHVDFPDGTVIERSETNCSDNAVSYNVCNPHTSMLCEVVRYHWGDSITINKKACLSKTDSNWASWVAAADSVSVQAVPDGKPYDAVCDYRFTLQNGDVWYVRSYRYVSDTDITFLFFRKRTPGFEEAEPIASSFYERLTVGQYITKGLLALVIAMFIYGVILCYTAVSDDYYDKPFRRWLGYVILTIGLLALICMETVFVTQTFWHVSWPDSIWRYVIGGCVVCGVYMAIEYWKNVTDTREQGEQIGEDLGGMIDDLMKDEGRPRSFGGIQH